MVYGISVYLYMADTGIPYVSFLEGQGIIFHIGKRKIIFNSDLGFDMLVPSRVMFYSTAFESLCHVNVSII